MNAVEIRNLSKSFGEKLAVGGLDMTVPAGAIYGFIGENGSGKSTTEKMLCGLLPKSGGSIKIYGKDYTDAGVRSKIGVLIEAPGCYPSLSVWNNLMIHAEALGIKDAEDEVRRVLRLVRMEGAAGNKYKRCSLGMKQRIGIALALMGDPALLVLDEPLNGLDADGMRIMREVLTDVVRDGEHTVLVSSHLLGELQKVATHYGIIRHGRMLREMTAAELDESCRTYVAVRVKSNNVARGILSSVYARVEEDESGAIRVYDAKRPEDVVRCLYERGVTVCEVRTDKISLEEYYVDLMGQKS